MQEHNAGTKKYINHKRKPNHIEVAFFPYQLSMWDSMESIYLAADNDLLCEAYVVPIPWYERQPDGSLGEMHYDGDQYPKRIPIINWREYDVETRRPDIIFIHNPYDNGNKVTSVHPNYYAKRLKGLAKLLVYVLYFICIDDVPEHLCINAAALYADMVIIQSEKIRQTYVRVFKQFEKEHSCKGKFGNAEKKFIALGSPKIDKIINRSRKDYIIPEDWAKLIGNRKIVLYNTTVGVVLQNGKKYLKKIRHIFEVFHKRDDVILWWRPHPLTMATYKSMRQWLLNEYTQIIDEYKRGRWGIYDDTSDLNRAIAYCDLCYGDMSSLATLCYVAGKPVMIQNINAIPDNKAFNSLVFENLFDYGGYFWFTAFEHNALYRMDKVIWKAEYMGSFQNEEINGRKLYGQIAEHNGKLYFAPLSAIEIGIYDVKSRQFEKISISKLSGGNINRYYPSHKFYSVATYKECVFFVGFGYPSIVRYDTKNKKTDYFTDWVAHLNKRINFDDGYFNLSYFNGNTIIAAACNTNAVVSFNMDSCTSDVYEVGGKKCGYAAVTYDGEYYWLAPRHDGSIVRWNMQTNEYIEYSNFPDEYIKTAFSFRSIVYTDGCLYMFPISANMGLKLALDNGSAIIADEPQIPPIKCLMAKLTNGSIHIFIEQTNTLISYNPADGKRREEVITSVQEAAERAKLSRMQFFNRNTFDCSRLSDCFFYEGKVTRLADFLDYISSGNDKKKQAVINIANADGSSGQMIYNYAREALICIKQS